MSYMYRCKLERSRNWRRNIYYSRLEQAQKRFDSSKDADCEREIWLVEYRPYLKGRHGAKTGLQYYVSQVEAKSAAVVHLKSISPGGRLPTGFDVSVDIELERREFLEQSSVGSLSGNALEARAQRMLAAQARKAQRDKDKTEKRLADVAARQLANERAVDKLVDTIQFDPFE